MNYFIYKLTNTKNSKIYIGQTNDPERRWHQHRYAETCDKNTMVVARAIKKYGAINFTFELIATSLTRKDVGDTEIAIIAQYNSTDMSIGYNVSPGGHIVNSPESLKRLSASLQKYYETHDGWNKGGTLTEEWKNNISKSSMGKPGTNTGKEFSNEWKVKISKANAGKEIKSRRRFSEEVEKEICKIYVEEGKSRYALGIQFDCQRSLIRDILDRNNIEPRISNYTGHSNGKNIFTKEQELEICRLYLAGNISRTQLSKQFKCGKTTIRDVLLRNNIKL